MFTTYDITDRDQCHAKLLDAQETLMHPTFPQPSRREWWPYSTVSRMRVAFFEELWMCPPGATLTIVRSTPEAAVHPDGSIEVPIPYLPHTDRIARWIKASVQPEILAASDLHAKLKDLDYMGCLNVRAIAQGLRKAGWIRHAPTRTWRHPDVSPDMHREFARREINEQKKAERDVARKALAARLSRRLTEIACVRGHYMPASAAEVLGVTPKKVGRAFRELGFTRGTVWDRETKRTVRGWISPSS